MTVCCNSLNSAHLYHQKLTTNQFLIDTPSVPSKLISISLVTTDEISKLNNQASNEQCNLDPISTYLMLSPQAVLPILATVITNIKICLTSQF
jgi:hypothetical protein